MMKYDVAIIGGGQSGCALGVKLFEDGKNVCVISTGGFLGGMLPLVRYAKTGADMLRNTTVVSARMENGRVKSIRTNTDITIEADTFVLATGKFFSKGLVADMNKVYEPLFGLDVEFAEDPSGWSDPDFFAPQPFEEFGVKTKNGKALKNGEVIDNLFACGEILCGKADIEKSVETVCRNIK